MKTCCVPHYSSYGNDNRFFYLSVSVSLVYFVLVSLLYTRYAYCTVDYGLYCTNENVNLSAINSIASECRYGMWTGNIKH